MPKSTADNAAMTRAAHRLIDDPKIFDDFLAGKLAGLMTDEAVLAAFRAHQEAIGARFGAEQGQNFTRAMRAASSIRSRIAEDRLTEALARGVKQFVPLGAGLDSTAYRRRDLLAGARVYELDLLVYQTDKRERLAAAGIEVPENVVFAPIDFETDTIVGALGKHGFRPDEPAFFTWLGVTPFLTENAIYETLGQIGKMAPGTEIAFEHPTGIENPDPAARDIEAMIKASAAVHGEDAKRVAINPAVMESRLKELGFSKVNALIGDQVNEQYFAGRSDGLKLLTRSNYVCARVG